MSSHSVGGPLGFASSACGTLGLELTVESGECTGGHTTEDSGYQWPAMQQ